ncbi:MAG: DUF4956 domain-containing protein, partial [Oscillospiraceae bacterium]|nr:DUF4956 domain-containing protein [Oscillospiraceae bacterium]
LFIYRRTYRGVLFSHGFAFSLVLLAMVTALVIRTISSNLALSLGMVGALSIVRFRTAIKDPIDTVFMFWSIVCGIMAGAGLILIGLVASVGVGALYAIISMFLHKTKSPYLLVVRYEPDKAANIGKALNYLPRYRIKSRTVTRGMAEVTVEVSLKESEMATVDKFLSIPGVLDASIVSYEGEFGL